jgi:hypothetical protein
VMPQSDQHIRPDLSLLMARKCRRDFSDTPVRTALYIVLPDSEYAIALLAEFAPRTIIAASVPVNLLLPEIRPSVG